MKTIILPGFSIKNKNWAEDCKKRLDPLFPTEVHYWKHWETGSAESDWIEKEVEKIIKEIGDDKANIIAKSIGTFVTTIVLNKIPTSVNKLVLCGIPVNDLGKEDIEVYKVLSNFPAKNLLSIQNENDNHGSYLEVKKLLDGIIPHVRLVSKPRSDHEYYYFEDVLDFLK